MRSTPCSSPASTPSGNPETGTISADLSYSDAWRENQWQAIYLSDVYPPSLVFNVTNGQVPYAATPGFNPADPCAAVGGRLSQQQRVGRQRHRRKRGPEVTQDQLAALALNFSRDARSVVLRAVKFGGSNFGPRKDAPRESMGTVRRHRIHHIHHPRAIRIPRLARRERRAREGSGPVLANAGLSQFSAPSFTAPPLVYGNLDSLFPLVYPNSGAPAGSDMPLVRTEVDEKTYEG